MRSIVIEKKKINQCGICKEKGYWLEEMNIDGTSFLYCYKCNTINFYEEVDKITQHRIEHQMNKYYHMMRHNKKT